MREFLRPGSIPIHGSTEGNGHRIGIEHYLFQGLAIETDPYDPWVWLEKALMAAHVMEILGPLGAPDIAAGRYKHPGRTPLGTPVAELARKGHDMLAAPCGYCGWNLSVCKCGKGSESGESE